MATCKSGISGCQVVAPKLPPDQISSATSSMIKTRKWKISLEIVIIETDFPNNFVILCNFAASIFISPNLISTFKMEKKKGGKNKNEKAAEKPKKATTEVKAAATTDVAPANPNKKRKWADIQRERVQAKAAAAASALASSATQKEAANTGKKEEKKEKKEKKKEDSATPSSSAAATPEAASKSPAGGDDEKNQKKKKKRKRKKQKKQPTKTGPDGEVIQVPLKSSIGFFLEI